MIDSVLRTLTFGQLSLHQWRQVSLLHRLLSPLRQWRLGASLLSYGDLIAAAINDAVRQVEKTTQDRMAGMLPPGMKMPF